MRWLNYWVAVGGLTLLPVVSFAQVPEDSTDADATEGSTAGDAGIVDFDIGDNVLGNPDDGGTVSDATVKSLTFLSGGADPVTITANIINLSLSFLGLLCLLFMAYAGFTWFTAGDNEEEVTKAKDIIKGAIIGLAVVLGSMGIAQLFFNNTVLQTTATSLLPVVLSPAYAQEEEEPTYEPETLPFDPNQGTDTVGSTSLLDLGTADPVTIVIAMVNGLFTLLALVFLILLVYAGVLWVTARGNEEQIVKAKTVLKRAVVGLIIVLSAYGITNVVTNIIYPLTGGDEPGFGFYIL